MSPRSSKSPDYFRPVMIPKATKNTVRPTQDSSFTSNIQKHVTIRNKFEDEDETANFGFGEPKLLLPRIIDSDTSDDGEKEPYDWKDEDYWKLPKNVQAAVDLACQNQKHSPFFYKLQGLNDKLFVYHTLFSNETGNERMFRQKHKDMMKMKLYHKQMLDKAIRDRMLLEGKKKMKIEFAEKRYFKPSKGVTAMEMIGKFKRQVDSDRERIVPDKVRNAKSKLDTWLPKKNLRMRTQFLTNKSQSP